MVNVRWKVGERSYGHHLRFAILHEAFANRREQFGFSVRQYIQDFSSNVRKDRSANNRNFTRSIRIFRSANWSEYSHLSGPDQITHFVKSSFKKSTKK